MHVICVHIHFVKRGKCPRKPAAKRSEGGLFVLLLASLCAVVAIARAICRAVVSDASHSTAGRFG